MGRRIYIRPEISRLDDDGQHPRVSREEGRELQKRAGWEKEKTKRKKAVAYRKRLERDLARQDDEICQLRAEIRTLRTQLRDATLSHEPESQKEQREAGAITTRAPCHPPGKQTR